MAELLDSGSPRRPLTFIGEDQDRRAQAKRDLEFALQNYTRAVSRERELDLQPLAEIWCQYAATIYDSLAKSYQGLPGEWKALFGESGVLFGGQTRAEVEEDVKRLRVPRPEHWPDPEIYRDGDSAKVRRAMRRILVGKDVGFAYLLDEPWFTGQITDCLGARVHHWKDKFAESREPPPQRQPLQQPPVLEPNSAGGTAKGWIRKDQPARLEIEKFATNAFAVSRDRILRECAEKKRAVLVQVARTGNSGGYLPALTTWGAERLREMILAQADAYVEAFTIHGVPADPQAEKTLETTGMQFAAVTISGILGELDLMAKRTGKPQNTLEGYINREINHATRSALEEGKLQLQQQRITTMKAQNRADLAPSNYWSELQIEADAEQINALERLGGSLQWDPEKARVLEMAIKAIREDFASVSDALKVVDWNAFRAGVQAWRAEMLAVEGALGVAIPLTPASREERIDLLRRFSLDQKGLGLTEAQFWAMATPEWLKYYRNWQRARVDATKRQSAHRTGSESERGNLDILRGTDGHQKRAVTLDVARRFGGVTARAIQDAAHKGTLKTEGRRQQRRVLVDSLLEYFPPEK